MSHWWSAKWYVRGRWFERVFGRHLYERFVFCARFEDSADLRVMGMESLPIGKMGQKP